MTTAPDATLAADRLLSNDAAAEPLEPLSLDPGSVQEGVPTAAGRRLAEHGSTELGIWELTPGTVTDVEMDECFVIVAGRGTVAFADGSAIGLRPGVVVRLSAGDRTTWRVDETVRKVYLA